MFFVNVVFNFKRFDDGNQDDDDGNQDSPLQQWLQGWPWSELF